MRKRYLQAGECVATHGIHGEFRVYLDCDSVEFLAGFHTLYLDEEGKSKLQVLKVRAHKNVCVLQVQDVHSVEDARAFVGKVLYIDRNEANLEEGRYFWQDLINARVLDADTGHCYGRITQVTHPGRHDVWCVQDEKCEYWFPAVAPFLLSVDIENEVALVRPIEGMFEPPLPKKEKGSKSRKTRGKGAGNDTN